MADTKDFDVKFTFNGKEYEVHSDNENFKVGIAEICADPTVLDVLARDSSERVQIAVAKNPNISEKTAVYLANSSCFDVKFEALRNRNQSEDFLKKTISSLEKVDWKVEFAIACNPNLPQYLLKRLIYNSDWRVMVQALNHPNMVDLETIEQKANVVDERVSAAAKVKLAMLESTKDLPN